MHTCASLLLLQPGTSVQAADGPCPGTYTAAVTCVVTYFPYTSDAQIWSVPDGVTTATIDVFAAQGGGSGGGLGGEATATIAVTPGHTYQINVGGSGRDDGEGGFNGGGGGGYYRGGGGTGGGDGDPNGPAPTLAVPEAVEADSVQRESSFTMASRVATAGSPSRTGSSPLHPAPSSRQRQS
jgi:hypothetical protein